MKPKWSFEERVKLYKQGFRGHQKRAIKIWAKQMKRRFTVKTLEGKMWGKAGDYLIIGFEGEKYPCKKEIFEKTYTKPNQENKTLLNAVKECEQKNESKKRKKVRTSFEDC